MLLQRPVETSEQPGQGRLELTGRWNLRDERPKCIAVFDKIIPFVQQHGTKAQYKNALHLQLPGSPLFDYLEGIIPRPDQTYLKLAEMIEVEETERINKEIANRRSRLGAVYGQVVTEVRREIWGASPVCGIRIMLEGWMLIGIA